MSGSLNNRAKIFFQLDSFIKKTKLELRARIVYEQFGSFTTLLRLTNGKEWKGSDIKGNICTNKNLDTCLMLKEL